MPPPHGVTPVTRDIYDTRPCDGASASPGSDL